MNKIQMIQNYLDRAREMQRHIVDHPSFDPDNPSDKYHYWDGKINGLRHALLILEK